MRAIVVYDSRFGNTESIAHSLASGIEQAGIAVDQASVKDADLNKLVEYDFIAVGAPTEFLTASKAMKEFLKRLNNINLKGKFGFAFDTKLESRLSGSGAKFIEKNLGKSGLVIIRPHGSAIVHSQKQKGRADEVLLNEGMNELFVSVGNELGKQLQSSQSRKTDAL